MSREIRNSIFEILSEEEFIAYLERNHVEEKEYIGYTALERTYTPVKMELGREIHVGQMVGLSLSDAAK